MMQWKSLGVKEDLFTFQTSQEASLKAGELCAWAFELFAVLLHACIILL